VGGRGRTLERAERYDKRRNDDEATKHGLPQPFFRGSRSSCSPCITPVRPLAHIFGAAKHSAADQRPSLRSPRSVMHVLIARATSRPSTSVTSHSVRPIVFPAVARSFPLQNGRRKLILSSRVVKLSPSPRVDAYATP